MVGAVDGVVASIVDAGGECTAVDLTNALTHSVIIHKKTDAVVNTESLFP